MKKFIISNSDQRKTGAGLSYILMALSILSGLIYTPFLIRTVGADEYGLYGTVLQLVSLLQVLNFGFSSSYIRFYSKYNIGNEKEKINRFNGLFFLVFSIIALIALVIGLFLSFNLELVFNNGLTEIEYSKAQKMMLLLTASTFVSFLSTIFGCYIRANQKFIFSKTLSLITSVLDLILKFLVIYLHFGIVSVVLITVSISIITNVIYCYYSFAQLNLKIKFDGIEKKLFRQLFSFSGLIAINMVVDRINTGIDSIILGRFCGTAAVAVYSVGSCFNNYFMNFSIAVSDIFVPHVHNLVNSFQQDSNEQREILTRFFIKIGRIQYLILSLVLSGFVVFGREFINFWAGDGYDQSYYIALILMIPSIVPLIQNVGIEIQRAENRHIYRSLIYGIMAIFNLIISIILCQRLQGIGVAIGTGIAVVLANGIIMNIVYHKKINIDMIAFWKEIIRQTVGMIIPYIVGYLIIKFVSIDSIIQMAFWIVIYTIVFCVCVWLMAMNQYEKDLVLGVVRKILRRTKL